MRAKCQTKRPDHKGLEDRKVIVVKRSWRACAAPCLTGAAFEVFVVPKPVTIIVMMYERNTLACDGRSPAGPVGPGFRAQERKVLFEMAGFMAFLREDVVGSKRFLGGICNEGNPSS
jgi:hypothetical protein